MQVSIIGNFEDSISELISSLIDKALDSRFEIHSTGIAHPKPLLTWAQNQKYDLFVIVLNNLILTSDARLDLALEVVSHLKTQYGKPVIAMSGYFDNDPQLGDKARRAGADAFFFSAVRLHRIYCNSQKIAWMRMKLIIVYALTVIGIPNFAGILAGGIVGLPITWMLKPRNALILIAVQDVFSGLGCLVSGIVLFRLFGFMPTFIVPTISGVWSLFYYLNPRYAQHPIGLLLTCLG